MHARELRQAFVNFFAERDHHVVQSASLIPHDQTLLFTVAGMVPFKSYFIGEEPPPWPRAVSVQKCVRAGGKHNDLDEIGRTSRHLSFFEMLGNFSFGDYFKSVAIPLAWEFVTEVLALDPQRLWVTVHLSDDEAEAIWRDVVGVPPERIQRLDEDNYWKMGDVGPCGPCSEIFWDKGPEYGPDGGPELGGEDRFVEIWNLVFMQFEQLPDGSKVPLPAPSIDTGAGLERILSVLQSVDSVWELDEIRSLIAIAERLSGQPYGVEERTDISLRILAEHARTTAFLIADGVIPSNEDRGYVLRRIMRRAIRHAYLLGMEDSVLVPLVEGVIELMGQDYPELRARRSRIVDIATREEQGFRTTLAHGVQLLDTHLDGAELDGSVAFLLHDTYGFPFELTAEIAAERGIAVDVAGFEAEMLRQRERAKAARKSGAAAMSTTAFASIGETHGGTIFERDLAETTSTVLAVVDDAVILDRTPFYAESGGQVGDRGIIRRSDGEDVQVTDTVFGAPGVIAHIIHSCKSPFEVGEVVHASIDVDRRQAIRRHHTATHLAHWALRTVLGEHVQQQGSWVGPDRLRFDFSHFQAMTQDELRLVEDLVNGEVLANPTCSHIETSKEEALASGAIAFFGDKYGDRVRVMRAGPHSVELCGGTHVSALGEIGAFKVLSESSIGSNIRRIEAVVGAGVLAMIRSLEDGVAEVARELGAGNEDLAPVVARRMAELRALRQEVKDLKSAAAGSAATELLDRAQDGVLIEHVMIETRDELRDMALTLRDRHALEVVVLFGSPGGKGVAVAAAVGEDVALSAGECIGPALALVGGGGGKGDRLATAGGRNADGIDAAIAQVRVTVAEHLTRR